MPAADLAGRPDLIERNFTADAPVPETGRVTSPHAFLAQEGFVYPADRDGTALLDTGLPALRQRWDTCEPTCFQNALQNWRFGTPQRDDSSCRV